MRLVFGLAINGPAASEIFHSPCLTRVLHVNCGCQSVCPTDSSLLNDLLPTVKNERNEADVVRPACQADNVDCGKVSRITRERLFLNIFNRKTCICRRCTEFFIPSCREVFNCGSRSTSCNFLLLGLNLLLRS